MFVLFPCAVTDKERPAPPSADTHMTHSTQGANRAGTSYTHLVYVQMVLAARQRSEVPRALTLWACVEGGGEW